MNVKPCLFATLIILLSCMQSLQSQNEKEELWWPHPIWGEEDQVGASNWITPEKVLESVSLVKTGKIYELGFMYDHEMPLLSRGRKYEMTLPPTVGPITQFSNMLAHVENLSGTITQVGTQFDGLGHAGRRIRTSGGKEMDVFYNGIQVDEMYSPQGLKKLGVENVKPIITKGILIDVAAFKKVETLPNGYVVTMEDINGTLKLQGIEEENIQPGDALLFNFGWWRIVSDRERYENFNWPGISKDVANWIIEKKVSMIGSDTTADPPGQFPAHFDLMMRNGIYNLEFMTFESIMEDGINEFLFIVTPLRLKGATGSPVRPIAIH